MPAASKKPEFKPGQPVRVTPGDWGAGNRGKVVSVADKPDRKGRYFVAVEMEGRPDLVGDLLPRFEAGLVHVA